MPYKLKETGESYEQFLKRNRRAESRSKDCLPENVKMFEELKMYEELTELLKKDDVVNLGWMNSWSKDSESFYKHLVESGVKFERIRQNGYWEYYNVKEKVVFKVDSGG